MKIRKVKNAVGLVGNIVADMNATGVNDVPNTSTIKRYVDSKTIGEGSTVIYSDTAPVGTIRLFGREDLPEGWLPCNGAAYLKTEYASLYEAINVTFNKIDDDPRYFRVPDLSGNVPVGYGGDGEFSLGNTGGEKEHILTVDEMPSHAHNLQWDKEGAVGSGNGTLMKNGNTSTSYVYSTGSRGGNQPHNNMPPYVVVKYAIKAVDSTPTHGTIIDSMIGESTINAPSVNAVKSYINKTTEIDVNLETNVTIVGSVSKAYKTNDGFAVVNIKFKKTTPTSGYNKLGVMPQGSRPIGQVLFPYVNENGDILFAYIDVAGGIYGYVGNVDRKEFNINITYKTAD